MLQRMKELVSQLVEADIAYYKYDRPIMTDREYDLFYDELLDLESKTGVILSGSPTRKVSGELLEGLTEVRHSKPMLSAGKTKSKEDVVKFAADKTVIVSWKLDGLTIVLRYANGELKQAITRGAEGLVGEDVTHTVRVMTNVPLKIACSETFEVRGEGVISWANFKKINANLGAGEEPYSHPRNLASGALRRLDAEKSKGQYVEFVAFDWVSDDSGYSMKEEQLAKLDELGFTVVRHETASEHTNQLDLLETIRGFNPQNCKYPVDGLIIEYSDIAYGQSLGATGHHENRMIALKWEDELHETTFLGLELATTRTGMVSLTGKFEDVVIDGSVVNRAYLHNLDILEKFKLGIGDRVLLYKANMIIPQMAENLTMSNTLILPTKCPCCGSVLETRTSENGTRFLYCENGACPAKLIRKFVHFCSKTRMDIEGLSEKNLEKLINVGLVRNFGDLYELEQHKLEIANLPGFGTKLVQRILASIEESRSRSLNQLLASFGIHTVGRTASRTISTYFHGDWDEFEAAIRNCFSFTQLQDFGLVMHDNIYKWYCDTEEEKLWRPVIRHINFKKEEENPIMNTSNPFVGKTVVATGKLENYTRDGIQMKLLSLGAKPGNSVSKNTDYLIAGEAAGGKLEKAKSFGVPILSETEFENMLTQSGENGDKS